MPDRVDNLSRGELLRMAEELTKMASLARSDEMATPDKTFVGSPKDPIVRTLAAMMLHRLKEIEEMSYSDIAALVGGVSRERICQLYHQLLDNHDPQEKLEEAGLT